MKILIFGKGYIGVEYLNSGSFDEAVLSEKDITKPDEIESEIEKYKPGAIINCAGWTNLEWCRDNKLETLLSNVAGPLNLLKAAKKADIYFVHLATGCIFDGDPKDKQIFNEEDKPNLKSFYGYTKALADELLMQENYDKILILRLRLPISDKPHPRNLITKIINFSKLSTSQNSMTYLPDLISATKFLLEKKISGLFNVCNKGVISPYEIAVLAKNTLSLTQEFLPASKEEMDELDKNSGREKRVDAVLSMDKLDKTGFQIADIRQRIAEALEVYKSIVIDREKNII